MSQTTTFNCSWLPQYAAEDWRKQAEKAISQGQLENEFLLSCHIQNRPAALKAYRKATKEKSASNS